MQNEETLQALMAFESVEQIGKSTPREAPSVLSTPSAFQNFEHSIQEVAHDSLDGLKKVAANPAVDCGLGIVGIAATLLLGKRFQFVAEARTVIARASTMVPKLTLAEPKVSTLVPGVSTLVPEVSTLVPAVSHVVPKVEIFESFTEFGANFSKTSISPSVHRLTSAESIKPASLAEDVIAAEPHEIKIETLRALPAEQWSALAAARSTAFHPENTFGKMPSVTNPAWQDRVLRHIGLPLEQPGEGQLTILHPRFRRPEQLRGDFRNVSGLYGNSDTGYGLYQRVSNPSARPYFKNVDAVVQVVSERAEQSGGGSGFVFNEQGLIATAAHTLDAAKSIEVRWLNGLRLPARVLSSDEDLDLAILKVEPPTDARLKIAPLGSNANTMTNSRVAAVGHHLGLKGLYASLGRFAGSFDVTLYGDLRRRVLIEANSAAVGLSGGPIFNETGDVIAIVTDGLDRVKTPDGQIYCPALVGTRVEFTVNRLLNRAGFKI